VGRAVLAGDQVGELGQHPSPPRSGHRHHGRGGLGRDSCERHAAYLRWPRCSGPGNPADGLLCHACPGSSDKRRDFLQESCGHCDHGGRPHIRRREAIPEDYSAVSQRVVSGPAFAVARDVRVVLAQALAFVLAQALEIVLAQALEIVLAQALDIALAFALTYHVAFAFAFALVIPVADGLRTMAWDGRASAN